MLVGGWAVSAFQSRLTTDIDAVIPATSLDDYTAFLDTRGYEQEFEKDVSKRYQGRIVQYTKPVGEHEVKFEALVDAIRCRQTDAEWSYRYLHQHSTTESLAVAEDLVGRIPEPALLFAMKLHGGRKADTRDLVVISTHAAFDRVEQHLHRGESTKLDRQIEAVLERLQQDDFEDAFKGVFQQEELPTEAIADLVSFLSAQQTQL